MLSENWVVVCETPNEFQEIFSIPMIDHPNRAFAGISQGAFSGIAIVVLELME